MFAAATFIAVVLLALAHVFVARLAYVKIPASIWKSAGAGVGVAYVFLVLLPKLARAQSALEAASDSGLYGYLVHHSYLVALLGVVIYCGMDAAVENVLVLPDRRGSRRSVQLLVFTHAASVLGYYFLVSYVMSEQRQRGYMGYVSLGLFATAMMLHYLSMDEGLRYKYGGLYDRRLRWVFAAASVSGWVLAMVTEIPYAALALLNSLFAGALLVFTLREKTPGSDRIHFRAFITGIAGYSLLLVMIELVSVGAS